MDYQHITVAGGGVLGSQIAYQTAFKGFNVCLYDIDDDSLERAKERIMNLKPRYQKDLGATEEEVQRACDRISFTCDLSEAVAEADLMIEAIPEVADIKTEFYRKLGKVAPEKTVFATNSSTLLPSQFADATGRPEKFLALHFANEIWKNNTAEIMKHPRTDLEAFQEVIQFAKQIGMVPLALHKEQPGYILNSLLVPFLSAAQSLLAKEVADIETIDKTWMIATGAPRGPFAILDVVGLKTAYNIALAKAEKTGDPESKKVADLLKTEYIDKGKLGRETGEGFYTYPHPSFMNPDFLKGE
ncbi:3-hydroxybutyryl-CoA dehydrogenase [Kroppenstedtia guangzhouensis]|uniref:3-hydroxybutyryl-CoA dehydrogenase n=1 Tax=Kroppenstedtia guangzhouensis TaxID=1274356 RepID=A0ABQ1GGR7_9BACL|nr:3-hydroxyacyl-CoA dehydrogenase [Kroppenstedtia guangzhouensis]GGA43498.1 3-hydroxybutyryl-CoA dehydrogenase [Kroppenstedtia guangzhouensis]